MLDIIYFDNNIEIQVISSYNPVIKKDEVELHIFTDEFGLNNDYYEIDNIYRDDIAKLIKYLDIDCELMRSDEITVVSGKLEIKFGSDCITLYHKR